MTLYWLSTFSLASASLEYLTSTDVKGSCHTVTREGLGKCCCNLSTCGSWGDPCGGDLAYPLCQPNEILGPEADGQAYFGDSHPVDQGDICYKPGGCSTQIYEYIYVCCGCPYNYQVFDTQETCDTGNLCVGCNNQPYEKLTGNADTGFSCTSVAQPCPALSAKSDPRLKGSQVVVNTDFQSAIDGLVACAKSTLGTKGALNVQSTSRCSASQGLTPAQGLSDHQVGQAIDTNLVLNDGSACDRDYCMRQGYCAYHSTALDCQGYKITQATAKNEQVNNFLNCAGKISGLEVGASYKHGDWNHFEKGSPTTSQFNDYQQQLKAFCQAKPGCPGITKVNPTNDACKCYV